MSDMTDIDRFDAEVFSNLLQVPVQAIPENHDELTRQLWQVVFGTTEMPESVQMRWQELATAVWGGGW